MVNLEFSDGKLNQREVSTLPLGTKQAAIKKQAVKEEPRAKNLSAWAGPFFVCSVNFGSRR